MFSSIARTAVQRTATRGLVTAASRPLSSLVVSRPTPAASSCSWNGSSPRSFATAPTFLPAEEVTDRIVEVVKNFDKVDPTKVSSASKFADDLGLDSLDAVEVVMAIEDEFAIEIPDAEADKIASVSDAVEYVAAHPMAK